MFEPRTHWMPGQVGRFYARKRHAASKRRSTCDVQVPIARSALFWHVLNAQRQRPDIPEPAPHFHPRAASAPAHISAHTLYFETSLKPEDIGAPSLGAEMEASAASAKGLRVRALAEAHERVSARTNEALVQMRAAVAHSGTHVNCVHNVGEGRQFLGARAEAREERLHEVLRQPLAREIMQAMVQAEAEAEGNGGVEGTFGYKQVFDKVHEVVQAQKPMEHCSLPSFHATFKLFLSEQIVARCEDRTDHFQLVRAEAVNASAGYMAAIQERKKRKAAAARAAASPPVDLPGEAAEHVAMDVPADGVPSSLREPEGDMMEYPCEPDGDDWTPPEVDGMVVRARKKFDLLDADGSGMLDGAELEKLAHWVWSSFHPDGQPLSAEEAAANTKKILRRADSNEDGKMDVAEFEAYFRRTAAAISKYRRGTARNR